jgi:hypothetical protein
MNQLARTAHALAAGVAVGWSSIVDRVIHTTLACGVGVAVGLSSMVIGAAWIGAFGDTHPVAWVGAALLVYAWVIAIVGGLWYLLNGPTAPAEEDGGDVAG